MMIRNGAPLVVTACLLATSAAAQSLTSKPITLACQGPKIESLRFPYSGRGIGSAGTTASFEVSIDAVAQTARINGRPAHKAVFTDTEVALSTRRGGALIRIDRYTGAWRAAGGTGICTPVDVAQRAF